ncbi:unnamed protein product [Caenorhabditis brenneri]
MPPVFYLAFISKKCPFYLTAFFNIISDMVQLSTICFYLSTSIMADQYLISNERLSTLSLFFGWLFMDAWFLESIVQATMAINRFLMLSNFLQPSVKTFRLVVITLKRNDIFTFYKTLIFFIGVISLTFSTAYCSQYMLPCCITILDQAVLSITFVKVEGVYTYSNLLDLAYDICCTAIAITSYITVFRSIRKSHINVASSVQRNRNNQDIRYKLTCFHFYSSLSGTSSNLFLCLYSIFSHGCFSRFSHSSILMFVLSFGSLYQFV